MNTFYAVNDIKMNTKNNTSCDKDWSKLSDCGVRVKIRCGTE